MTDLHSGCYCCLSACHPPPSPLIKSALAIIRRVRISTAVRRLASVPA